MSVRILGVSVRGHRNLVGGGVFEAGQLVTPGRGTHFPDMDAARRHAQTELASISSYHMVHVVDDTGRVIAHFNRTAGGAGKRWAWQ